jgi:hypothetical protein
MSEFKKVTPTNFKVSIEKEFADIIYKINDESRSLITIRKKIEFLNGFYMNVTEHTEKGIYSCGKVASSTNSSVWFNKFVIFLVKL